MAEHEHGIRDNNLASLLRHTVSTSRLGAREVVTWLMGVGVVAAVALGAPHSGTAASAAPGVESKRLRILTAGIRHETNTFNTNPTVAAAFRTSRGAEALDKPWAKVLEDAGCEVIPTLHAYARPAGVVARSVYETFKAEILDGVRKAGRLDGVYLDMHGALHVDGYDDAQADFAKAIRGIVGTEVVIAASFDLHGNISKEFASELDIATAFRTAPHEDGDETKARATRLLVEALRRGRRPVLAFVPVPILVPGEKGITAVEPLKTLYGQLPGLAGRDGIVDASIMVGMCWTDVPRAGMSVMVVGDSPEARSAAEREARRIADELWKHRLDLDFDVPTDTLDGAIRKALAAPEKTVFVTDSGDNTTGGAAGDNTLVLQYLLANKLSDAVLAGIVDPEAVAACDRAGVGNPVKLTVGGKLDKLYCKPLAIEGTVRLLTTDDGKDLKGKSAVVDVQGVTLVLLGTRRSFTEPADFGEVGIDPLTHKIVIVKLGYLFPELRRIAPRTIMALTPGFNDQVIEKLNYKHVRRPIYPLDQTMSWQAQ